MYKYREYLYMVNGAPMYGTYFTTNFELTDEEHEAGINQFLDWMNDWEYSNDQNNA